jgi:hypothetical protein
MLALLVLQAVLGAEGGRNTASPSQSGSTAPALHTGRAQILDMSQQLILLPGLCPGTPCQAGSAYLLFSRFLTAKTKVG